MINTEKQKVILEILDGSSSRFRQTYFEKHYTDILKQIIIFCEKISDLAFNQKVWHWVNDNSNYFLCGCGNKITFNKNWLDGYKKHCSAKCAQTDQSTKNKRKKTTLKLYGVDNVAKSNDVKNKQEETNLKKYGTKSSFQNEDVKKKRRDSIKIKYGEDHIFKLK